jgi:hypothetical protein
MLFDASLTAWATLALAVLALVTAVFAFLAWRTQSAEIDALRSQIAAEARRRRESYVSKVFTWHEIEPSQVQARLLREQNEEVPPLTSLINFKNTAEVPVYHILFIWHVNGQMKTGTSAEIPLMPGEEISRSWQIPEGIEPESITTSVFIMDAEQQRWRITPDGKFDPYDESMLPSIVWATVPKLR